MADPEPGEQTKRTGHITGPNKLKKFIVDTRVYIQKKGERERIKQKDWHVLASLPKSEELLIPNEQLIANVTQAALILSKSVEELF